MNERFSRIERLVGAEGLARLAQARVAVIGLGAVGSYALEALVRAGVGHVRLMDFDCVRVSNINRQLLALESTLDRPKAQVARARVLDINPACQVEAIEGFFHTDTADTALAKPLDLAIDAIDSVTPKVELLAAARQRGIPILSSMGAALRFDPGCVRLGPLEDATYCPLAREVRKGLRRRGVRPDMICVYSVEQLDNLPDGALVQPAAADFDSLRRGRIRHSLGSLPTLTGIFGLTLANEALMMLLGKRP